jgi:hypothetical protein
MKAMMEAAITRGRTSKGPDLKNDVEVALIKALPKAKGKAKAN